MKTLKTSLVHRRAGIVAPGKKQADAHLGSKAHKDWAAEVFRRAGGRCQWPGCTKAHPQFRMYADHIQERSDGGAEVDVENGQLLCASHHTAKTAEERRKRNME